MVTVLPTYGGASSYFVNSKCPNCEASIDRHGIPSIHPSDRTTNLAVRLQALLDRLDIRSILKGYKLHREATMIGAAYARFGNSSVCDYVTVSGEGVLLLPHINQRGLGKAVVIVGDTKAAPGRPQSLYRIDGTIFSPILLDIATKSKKEIKEAKKHIGDCAAQKLLSRIFLDTQSRRGVAALEMSEIMWRSSTMERVAEGSREWSTGHVVPSCDLCMQVLPQMLCDQHD
jgi:hypothetical protein